MLGKKILLVPRIMVKFEPAVRGVSGVIPPGLPTLTSLRHFLPCIHPIRSPNYNELESNYLFLLHVSLLGIL